MRTIIIDDEADARDYLKILLDSFHPTLELLGTAINVAEGTALINATQPELVFLDVEMPDGTGIDLLKKLPKRNFQVIFCTAYDRYALEAIKLSALDYLLKPIDTDDLEQAVEKAKAKHRLPTAQLNALIDNFQQKDFTQKKLILKDKSNFYLVKIEEIIRCQGDGSYTTFHLEGGEVITVSKNLRYYQKILDERLFFRVHNSHLINLRQIKRITRQDGGYVVLSNLSEVPISKNRKEAFFQVLNLG